MSFRTLINSLKRRSTRTPVRPAGRDVARRRCRPAVECLEDRATPTALLVDTFADVVAADGLTSLREAVALAADPGRTYAGDDTIVLPHEIGGVAGTYALSLGQLSVNDATGTLTILSSGGPATIDAQQNSRVLAVSEGSKVEVQGLTITGGSADAGGGISNFGTMTVTDSTINNNSVSRNGVGNGSGNGGGILNVGTLAVTGCAISGNSGYAGGGIYDRGTLTATGNTISNNSGSGVHIEQSGSGTQLLGNTITGNSEGGVLLISTGGHFQIGSPLAGNTIAFNGRAGVSVSGDSTGVAIRGNAIYGNAGLGIDLMGGVGLTANDPGDADDGPNHLQNFPVLTSASSDGTSTTVAGAINSTPNTILLVDCYTSPPDGLGQTYVGAVAVLTDGNGNALFTATFAKPVAAGWAVTATATTMDSAPYGDTSELAAGIPVSGPGGGTSANQAPVNHVPSGAQSVAKSKTLTFSSANGNAISVSDPDASTALIQVSLTVQHGTLTLAGTAGLTFLAGDGTNDGTMTFQGTIEAVNTALDGLTYKPAVGYVGSDTLSITSNDLGSGLGDPLIDSDVVTILVGQKKK